MDFETLEQRFLHHPRPELEAFRRRARRAPDAATFYERVQPDLPEAFLDGESDRFYALGPAERGVQDEQVLDLRAGRLRPVAARPGNKAILCFLFASIDAVIDAEREARAFARALWAARGLDDPPTRIVWRMSSWGSDSVYADSPELQGFEDLVRPFLRWPMPTGLTSPFAHVVQRVEATERWNAARGEGTVVDVDLLGPYTRLWASGCGISAVNDDCIVLFLRELRTVPTRPPRRPTKTDLETTQELHRNLFQANAYPVQRCLENGADPNLRIRGRRGLHQLFARYFYARPGEDLSNVAACVKALVEHGADPSLPDDRGAVVTTHAAYRADLIAMLADAGIDVDVSDHRGRTALHQLSRMGHDGSLPNLLGAGASVSLPDHLGWTALHHAAVGGFIPVVQRLLAAGADPETRTRSGRSVAELMGRHEHAEALRALLPKGAREATGPTRRWSSGAVQLPDEVRAAVVEARPDAWQVVGDWLAEQGDPRGEAIALHHAGAELDAERILSAHSETWWSALVGVHPGVEALLAGESVHLDFEHGFIRAIRAETTRSGEHIDAVLALLGAPAGALVHSVRVGASGGDAFLAALSTLRSSSLRSVKVDATVAPEPLDLRGLTRLSTLKLRGTQLEAIEVDAPELRSLAIELPFLRNAELGPPLARLHTPRLTSLSLVLHRAPDAAALAFLRRLDAVVPPQLENLHVRPLSTEGFEALMDADIVRRLRTLRLDSLFEPTVQQVLRRWTRFRDLEGLHLTVLDMPKAARKRLAADLERRLSRCTLKGINYRPEGRYG